MIVADWLRNKWLRRRGDEERCANSVAREGLLQAFWAAWTPLQQAGSDAYYRCEYSKADEAFRELLAVAEKFDLRKQYSQLRFFMPEAFPETVNDSSRWWQASILRQGTHYWNSWRRTNPSRVPDLRGQMLTNNKCLNLDGADLSGADLSQANLFSTSVRQGSFRAARLVGAILNECDFSQSNFRGADLMDASCQQADLSHADLTSAVMVNTCLEWSGIHGTDFTDVVGLTEDQLESACGDTNTILPTGLVRPAHWEHQTHRVVEGGWG